MPFEERYFKGWECRPTGKVHASLEKANSDYGHGYALHSFRKNTVNQPLTYDKAFALKACKQCGNTLRLLSGELKNDEDVVLEAVQQDGLSLRFASPVMRREREIVLAACTQNGKSRPHLFF